MSDIGIQLGPTRRIMRDVIGPQLASTIVAVIGSKMILGSTFRAIGCQFPAGHGHEGTIVAFNDFQISYYKIIIERDATESAQSILGAFHKLDSDFSDFQNDPPLPSPNQSCGIHQVGA